MINYKYKLLPVDGYRAAILLFYKVVNKLIINIFISKVVKDRIDEKSKAWTDL